MTQKILIGLLWLIPLLFIIVSAVLGILKGFNQERIIVFLVGAVWLVLLAGYTFWKKSH